MQDHHQTAVQSMRYLGDYLRPSSYRVTHRLKDVRDLRKLVEQYDLFILDRDCSLQEYHGSQRVPEFENVLRYIAPASELVSNSSFKEFLKIGELYGNLFPVSKLVRFAGEGSSPFLLRFANGELSVIVYDLHEGLLADVTSRFKGPNNTLLDEISYNYRKPNPLIINAVVDFNAAERRIPAKKLKVLMVGDRFLTDIVAGNLAGVDTARVKPYRPFSDKPDLLALRYLVDSPLGFIMSRLT